MSTLLQIRVADAVLLAVKIVQFLAAGAIDCFANEEEDLVRESAFDSHTCTIYQVMHTLYCRKSSVNDTTIISRTPGHKSQKRGLGVVLLEAARPKDPKLM